MPIGIHKFPVALRRSYERQCEKWQIPRYV